MSNDQASPLHTPLTELHQALGAKMVPFAGYLMPVQFSGVKAEHLHTREKAGLFDVSHMGQVIVKGAQACAELERLIPVDLQALAISHQSYGVLTNEHGGIIDDLIIARWQDDEFFIVINAACKQKDLAHFRSNLLASELIEINDRALIALQGPSAAAVMQSLCPDATQLTFMQCATASLFGAHCYVSRSGYTGEDGFEISIPQAQAQEITEKLLAIDDVQPVGLGARDSLRLESGLCLYGQDLMEDTTVAESTLIWSISKSRRRQGDRAGGFLGAEAIFQQQNDGVTKKRVGLLVDAKTPVRAGAEIQDLDGNTIGKVTSGTFSPSLSKPLAMGYVYTEFSAVDTPLLAVVRGKTVPITVSKTPFVPQRYFRG